MTTPAGPWPLSSSGAKHLASTGAARVQDLAAILSCHACTEAVAGLADAVRGLKGAFHRGSPLVRSEAQNSESSASGVNSKTVL